jgi:hypothetical protein
LDFNNHSKQARKRTRDDTMAANVRTRLASISTAMTDFKQVMDKTLEQTDDAIKDITRMIRDL